MCWDFRGGSAAIGGLLLGLLLASGSANAQTIMGSGFTYQGQIKKNGSPYNGTCDLKFELSDSADIGTGYGTEDKLAVAVVNGIFTVELSFGFQFHNLTFWLKPSARCPAGSGSYEALTPAQKITAAPYALALPGLHTVPNATSPNIIGGSPSNLVSGGIFVFPAGGTIGGGGSSGGGANVVSDDYGTVGGGQSNRAGDNTGTAADKTHATVGGGQNNTASGQWSTVAGGVNNTASGLGSMVPGGDTSAAVGSYSFAAGLRATANVSGCFVWADASSSGATICSTANQFLARTSGGATFFTSSNLTTGVQVAAGGSGWGSVSKRDLKENFESIDTRRLLERLASIPISSWNYKTQDPSIRHVGPVADDFNTLLDGLGGEGRDYINSIDADGVALAAIQGLYQELKTRDARIGLLERELAEMREQLRELASHSSKIEDRRQR